MRAHACAISVYFAQLQVECVTTLRQCAATVGDECVAVAGARARVCVCVCDLRMLRATVGRMRHISNAHLSTAACRQRRPDVATLPVPVDSLSFICTCSFHITCHVLGTATPAHILEGRSLKESAKRRVPAGIKRTIQSMGAQSGSGVGVRRRAKRRRKVLFPSGHTEDGSQKQCNIMCW